ncbi:MAG: ABC transporter substrate-binding protein [Hyphomicrobiaceae bacterium]
MRIVSLIASATEIVWGLGYGDKLVARSHECDNPHDVTKLPAITTPKFTIDGNSLDIDRKVKAVVADGLAVYHVDPQALERLKPDLIVTQDQCEVCAVSLTDVERAVCQWAGAQAKIVSLKPDCLADIDRDIRKVAAAIGDDAAGERLAGRVRGRIDAVAEAIARLRRPRIAFIEWIAPMMSGGNWMPELIAAAGGENLFGEAGKHSGYMQFAELAAADPEVIIVAPCGFDIARTRAEMPLLEREPGWRELTAVRNGRVALADGNFYFNRPGPGVADTAEIIAEILHGPPIDYGYRGRGWMPYA